MINYLQTSIYPPFYCILLPPSFSCPPQPSTNPTVLPCSGEPNAEIIREEGVGGGEEDRIVLTR
jgi:hypothetical protein